MSHVLLAHHGHFFNHILEGHWDEVLTTPLDWFIGGMMVVFIVTGSLLVGRWAKSRNAR